MIPFTRSECFLMKIKQHSLIRSQHLVLQMQDQPGEIYLILQKCLESFCEVLHRDDYRCAASGILNVQF